MVQYNKLIYLKLIVFLILILTNLIVVYAWSWTGTQNFDCDGCCVEDKTFQYTTTITNTGS